MIVGNVKKWYFFMYGGHVVNWMDGKLKFSKIVKLKFSGFW